MGQRETICIVGGTNFLASVQNFALRRYGHTIHDGGRDLSTALSHIDDMKASGVTVALVNSLGNKEEGRRKEKEFAEAVHRKAPEIVVVAFSIVTKKEAGDYADVHYQRVGGEVDWERLPKVIASIREIPPPPRWGKRT